ncbi:MAG: hypothetical protein RIB45_03130 [Marivibrio sp.]|uniref:hypothetical protein n=1 Tax=Marivibrio sp. TaxID=2039719 RepID=UPI0032EC589D
MTEEPAKSPCDAALAAGVRTALAEAGPAPPPPGAAPQPRRRRLPGFLAFAGGALGASAAGYQGADALSVALTAATFALLTFLMGLRLARRMHPNQAAEWVTAARRHALTAAAAGLSASGRLSSADRLAAEDVENPTLDLRLLAQAGAAPPSAAGYLEEALAGRAAGVSYALGAVDHGTPTAQPGSEMRGRLLQIACDRQVEGAALMTWETGALAEAAHDWFARTHLNARPVAPPAGVDGVRGQSANGTAPFSDLPRGFFDALGGLLGGRDQPPFLLAATDRRLLLYLQGEGALTGDESALRDALTRAQSDPSALEGPALTAAEEILALHRLVATLAERSPASEA